MQYHFMKNLYKVLDFPVLAAYALDITFTLKVSHFGKIKNIHTKQKSIFCEVK